MKQIKLLSPIVVALIMTVSGYMYITYKILTKLKEGLVSVCGYQDLLYVVLSNLVVIGLYLMGYYLYKLLSWRRKQVPKSYFKNEGDKKCEDDINGINKGI